MRPIDADELSRKIQDEYHGSYSEVQIAPYQIDRMIDAQPTVATAQVVHAHWVYGYTFPDGQYRKCSACNESPKVVANDGVFCGSCGAKMDEEIDD